MYVYDDLFYGKVLLGSSGLVRQPLMTHRPPCQGFADQDALDLPRFEQAMNLILGRDGFLDQLKRAQNSTLVGEQAMVHQARKDCARCGVVRF